MEIDMATVSGGAASTASETKVDRLEKLVHTLTDRLDEVVMVSSQQDG